MIHSFLLILFSVSSTQATTSLKIDSFVQETLQKESTVDVIVYLKDRANLSGAALIKNRTRRIRHVYDQLRKTAQKSQKELLAHLSSRKAQHQAFYIENAVAIYQADQGLLDSLASFTGIDTIRLNVESSKLKLPITLKTANISDKQGEVPSHLKLIGAEKVWNELGVKGRGIVVAGQDSGYYWEHNAIKKQYRGNKNGKVSHNYNWHDSIHKSRGKCGENSRQPCDSSTSSHGTHTMGTILGDDGKGNRIGVAPEAEWIGCRNMNAGSGTAATYLECFEFFLAPYAYGKNPQKDGKPEFAPHIVNNSWACPPSEGCTGGEFLEAIRALHAAGILVVAGAGNEGPDCGSVQNPPGTYSDVVLSVASYNLRQNGISYFSSRGPSRWTGGLAPNITAPGSDIRSASSSGPDSYESLSGTSMAGPHVAGAAALLWSAKPELIGDIDRTIEILLKTATPRTSKQNCGPFPGDKVPNAVFGYGIVNIYKAITQ